MGQKSQQTNGRRKRGERGQSMVEFGLTMPILVLLLVGMVEIGSALNSYLTVLSSARDASRLYAQGGVGEGPLLTMVEKETQRLKNLPAALPTTSNECVVEPGVCITYPTVSGVTAVQVKVCYNHSPIIGIPGVLPNPMRMCSATTMRIAT